MAKKLEKKEAPDVGQYLFPMAGVMILVLATMIANAQALFQGTSIKVDIPKANVIEVDLEQSIPISITKDGKVYVQDKEMPDLNALRDRVKELQEKYALDAGDPELKGQQLTVIRADKEINWGRVLEVIDETKRAGCKRTALAVIKRRGGG
ncbi:MAG: biopolymer transporter ExbD [candidate division WOR-3 bacterium]